MISPSHNVAEQELRQRFRTDCRGQTTSRHFADADERHVRQSDYSCESEHTTASLAVNRGASQRRHLGGSRSEAERTAR